MRRRGPLEKVTVVCESSSLALIPVVVKKMICKVLYRHGNWVASIG